MGQIVYSACGHSGGAPTIGRTVVTFAAKVEKVRGAERGTGFLLTVNRDGNQATIKSSFDRAKHCEEGSKYIFDCHHNTSTRGLEPAEWTLAKTALLKSINPSNQPRDLSRG